MGVHEIAARLGVGNRRVHQIKDNPRAKFPAAVQLRCGLVWYADEVEAWISAHRDAEPSGQP
jgi:predicted DNA-binding transcriptional regulator AlpA